MMNKEKSTIDNIGEFIEYLSQFDKDIPLNIGYIQTIDNQIVDVKKRPIIKHNFIIRERNGYYIEPQYY